MGKHPKTLLVAATLTAGLGAAMAAYADGPDGEGGMMGEGGMRGMMGMMGQMSSMTDHCNEMMQSTMGDDRGANRPNEQWPDRQPDQPRQPQTRGDAG